MIKNLSANAGDVGLIPQLERSPGEGNGTPSSVITWEISWTEDSGGLVSMGVTGVAHDLATQQQHINFDMLCFDFHLSQSIF